MKVILVIGASGFIGRQLSTALLAAGYAVRCLARDPAKVADLASAGCDVVPGDIADPAAVRRAVAGVAAVYLSIHTLSPQPGSPPDQRFMAIEQAGVQNVLAACRASGTRRLIYITSLGTAADAPSEWLRERWQTEQQLLSSGLEATVIRPGFIVGVGGGGFDALVRQAAPTPAAGAGADQPKRMRPIALSDLIYYLVGVLDEPRAYEQGYDVGSDEVLTMSQLAEIITEVRDRRPVPTPAPRPSPTPPPAGPPPALPPGAMEGFVDSMKVDLIGDPRPIRLLLPRPLLPFQAAVEKALLT